MKTGNKIVQLFGILMIVTLLLTACAAPATQPPTPVPPTQAAEQSAARAHPPCGLPVMVLGVSMMWSTRHGECVIGFSPMSENAL